MKQAGVGGEKGEGEGERKEKEDILGPWKVQTRVFFSAIGINGSTLPGIP
jgi:hypothetical protein